MDPEQEVQALDPVSEENEETEINANPPDEAAIQRSESRLEAALSTPPIEAQPGDASDADFKITVDDDGVPESASVPVAEEAEAPAVPAAAEPSTPAAEPFAIEEKSGPLPVISEQAPLQSSLQPSISFHAEYNAALESDRTESEPDIVKAASEERRILTKINKELQRRVQMFWEKDAVNSLSALAREDKPKTQAAVEQLRSQYIKSLDQLYRLFDSIRDRKSVCEDKVERLTRRLDTEDENATELGESFKAFKREIAKGAEFTSGRTIKLKRILALEGAEEEKDREVEAVRLKNIHFLHQLEKIEREIKQKEELAEGLHLIDFEQLKIENQALNEKIEERNDELHKLRKKTTTTVQVLTHIKEKLTFVHSENSGLAAQLFALEEQVVQLRDKLTRAKHSRDDLRTDNTALKQKQGFVGSDLLVSDYEKKKTEVQRLLKEVQELQQKHHSIEAAIRAM